MHSSTIQQKLLGAKQIPADVINHISKERWLQIWVPKMYGGLGLDVSDGLRLLKSLAFIDGSLGWVVKLCAGANYFSRNRQPEIAKELFKVHFTGFGGSGAIGGTA